MNNKSSSELLIGTPDMKIRWDRTFSSYSCLEKLVTFVHNYRSNEND